MDHITEYTADLPYAELTVLRQLNDSHNTCLVLVSPGYEPAGSMARWTDGYYAVRFNLGGARHGQRYRERADAEAHYARMAKEAGIHVPLAYALCA